VAGAAGATNATAAIAAIAATIAARIAAVVVVPAAVPPSAHLVPAVVAATAVVAAAIAGIAGIAGVASIAIRIARSVAVRAGVAGVAAIARVAGIAAVGVEPPFAFSPKAFAAARIVARVATAIAAVVATTAVIRRGCRGRISACEPGRRQQHESSIHDCTSLWVFRPKAVAAMANASPPQRVASQRLVISQNVRAEHSRHFPRLHGSSLGSAIYFRHRDDVSLTGLPR
jgi:hypothetical protein